MTKQAFIDAYGVEVMKAYAWAKNPARHMTFMESVQKTLNGPVATWNNDGPAVVAAWRAIGGKGKPTLKALRALP